ncbi:MAG: hypothetical protein JWL83_10 [Actinomycetia bacterium]|nr:hypothetical protein [Actinomycetes bacterium]
MVTFSVRHEFDSPPEVVGAAMTDPAFVASLRLPDVGPPEVIDRATDGDGVVLRARFRFTGSLDPIARKIIPGGQISWVQEVHVDATNRRGRLTVIADTQPDRLRCTGEYRLEPSAAGGTMRELNGSLEVRVPLIGRRAEQHILPGLLRRIDLEAEALKTWLA